MACGLGLTFLLNDRGDVFVFGTTESPASVGLGPSVKPFFVPRKIPGLERIVDIRVGVNFAMAVGFEGEVWQWGTILEW